MELGSVLELGHDVYQLECTDEEDTYGFMVGNDKFIISSFSYPQKAIRIVDPDMNVVFNDSPDCIESVTPTYKDNDVVSIKLMINDNKFHKELILK